MANMKRQIRRRGVSTVEAAIVFPLLVFLTFALIEYGWLFLNAQQTTNAARHCARMAVRPDMTSEEVVAAADGMMQQYGLSDSGYSVTITPANIESVDTGEEINVEISVPYDNVQITGISMISGWLLALPANLKASVSMAKEGP